MNSFPDPEDTLNTQKLLASLRYYDKSEHGTTTTPNLFMYEGIWNFQSDNGLKLDSAMNPSGQTERTLNQKLAMRQEIRRSIPSSGGKTLLTGRGSMPTTAPRVPPAKRAPGNRPAPSSGTRAGHPGGRPPIAPPVRRPLPSQPQSAPTTPPPLRPGKRGPDNRNQEAPQRLAEEIKRVAASDQIQSDNAHAVSAALRVSDQSGLAWRHAERVNKDGLVALATLVDYGIKLHAADKPTFDKWHRAFAVHEPGAALAIANAVDAANAGEAPADTKGSREEARDSGPAANTAVPPPGSHRQGLPDADRTARLAFEEKQKNSDWASFMEWRNKQPKRSENTAFLAGPLRIQSSGPGDHRREAGANDPDRAARRRVVDWNQATETREDFVELIEETRKRGWHHAAYLLQHYIDGSGRAVTVPAELARKAPGVIDAERGAQLHFERWFTNSGKPRERNDTKFGNIFDFINPKNKDFMSPEDRQEWDITGMRWEGTGGSSTDLEGTDAHLSFGGAGVVAVVTKGKLIRQSDGSFTIEAVVEFHAKDTYNVTVDTKGENSKPEAPSDLPIPAAVAGRYFITPAHTAALEKNGGAKQFDVTSETWTRQLSGKVEANSHEILSAKFDWDELP